MDHVRKSVVAAVVALLLVVGVGGGVADASPKQKVDCTVLIFKPSFFWARGYWTPTSLRGTSGVADWYRRCSGKYRPVKKGPDAPVGPWRVNIKLNLKNCSYTADQNIKDMGWWEMARIVIL